MKSKICGVSDLKTLEFLTNYSKPPEFIGFIVNYTKSKRYVELDRLKKLLKVDKKKCLYVAVLVKPSKKILDQSKDWATRIAEELKYIGTLCVEFFIDRNENLYVNEIAPRVHNSGHLTINAYNVSQFENHVRAFCSLERIPLKKISNAKMVNLIGNQIEIYRKNPNLNKNEFFFDYLKKDVKEKRKMGHITTLI